MDDVATRKMMAEGNTLFLLGSANTFSEDETTDEFGLMPYLSEDGSQNSYILNVSRYIGLNKHLADAGNEQKLEDAVAEEGQLQDTGIVGLTAAQEYFSQFDTLSEKDLVW